MIKVSVVPRTGPLLTSHSNATAVTDRMENVFVFDDTYSHGTVRQNANRNDLQERDRRERAVAVVSKFKVALELKYPPLVAKEYLSLLFRQRGVPSVDMFTSEIVSSIRLSLGHSSEVSDTVRRILTLGTWSNTSCSVTMWTIEPVIASLCIRGNSLSVHDAKENFSKFISVVEPLTMTTHMNTIVNNELRGRWAGWLVSKQYEKTGLGNPACMSCNLCGPSVMFAIHRKGSNVIQMKLTPESIRMLANYSRNMNMATGATSSLIAQSSTRLKIQSGLDRPKSTCLSLYGNGSMQFSGSPTEIPILYPSMLEIVNATMNSEMSTFLRTMRRADVTLMQ